MKKINVLLFILIAIFILLSICIINDWTVNLDNSIYEGIMKFKSSDLTNFLKAITKLGNYKVSVIISVISIIFLKKLGLIIVVTSVYTKISNSLIKFIIKRKRHEVLRLVKVKSYSYPSFHAMISMAIYGVLVYLIWNNVRNKKLKIIISSILIVIIFLIGFSRIYLGAHYFSDVLAGYILSAIYLIVLDKLINKYKRNEKINE